MTVEDPIEYYIDGIGQTQVNTKVEMTFARGLRAILRQDPDVVMIGEIRDLETAQIAVQASLTGHLVLSTLHTNTAVGAVTRLRDMGIEPFLLSSSLIGVLAQRLVRVLNPETREPFMAGEYERRLLNLDPKDGPVQLYRPSSEPGSGYRGRTGIYELIAVDDHMRTMIHDGASEQDLERYARTSSPGIRDDGRRKVMAGETTLEEVLRVTREIRTQPDGRLRVCRARPPGQGTQGAHRGRHPEARAPVAARQAAPADGDSGGRAARAKAKPLSPPASCAAASRRSISRCSPASSPRCCAPACRSRRSLQAVAEQTEKPRVQRIVLGVRSKVVEGHPLADGLRDFPQAFPGDLSRDRVGRRAIGQARFGARAPRGLHRIAAGHGAAGEPRAGVSDRAPGAVLRHRLLLAGLRRAPGGRRVRVRPSGAAPRDAHSHRHERSGAPLLDLRPHRDRGRHCGASRAG